MSIIYFGSRCTNEANYLFKIGPGIEKTIYKNYNQRDVCYFCALSDVNTLRAGVR